MDGGGRNLGPLSGAGPAGDRGVLARLSGLSRPLLDRLARRSFPSRRLRGSIPIAQRLPRLLGPLGIAGAFGTLALTGFVASGRYEAFIAENGRPLDILARLAGFGVERVTTLNLKVVQTDVERGLILVEGAVPGVAGGWITVRDAIKKALPKDAPKPGKFRVAGGVGESAQAAAEPANTAEGA